LEVVKSVSGGIMELKDALRQAREKLGMSCEEMGRQIGVSGTAYRKWENGTNYPTVKRWRAIEGKTGVDASLYTDQHDESITQHIGTVTFGNATSGASATISQQTGDKLELSNEERELLLLFRQYGNPILLDKCRRKLRKIEALSR
jgi:transcriptional regulator with XRE-family HTH domain